MGKRDLLRRLDHHIESATLRKRSRYELKLLNEIRTALQHKPQIIKSGPKAPITIGQRDRVDRKLQPTEARIVAHIESYPNHCFALSDLLNDLKMPERTLKNCLMRLVSDGYITRPRRGFYGPVDL